MPYKRIPALYQKALDFQSKMWYTVFRDFGKLESAIRKRIEVVITALTRNQVARKGSWVRIPPLPPTLSTGCNHKPVLF